MANEIQTSQVSGWTVYAVVVDRTGNFWNTSSLAFEAFTSGNYVTKYATTLTEQGTTGIYLGTMPAAAAGIYGIVIKKQAGGSPAQSDLNIGGGDVQWTGSALLRLGVAIPDVAAAASGGLPTADAANRVKALDSTGAAFTYTTPPTVAQIATAVWEDTTAGGDFATVGSIGKLLVTTGLTVASVTGAVGSVTSGVTVTTNNDKTGYSLTQTFPANFAALGISVGGHVSNVDTLTTYTGNTVQTGDAYARLGAPAGASVSADVAAIKSETDTILADVNTGAGAIYTRLGAPTGASIAADIQTRATPAQILTTALTESYAAVHVAPTLSQALFWMLQSLTERSITSTTETVKKLDGSTTAGTLTLDDPTTPTAFTRAT